MKVDRNKDNCSFLCSWSGGKDSYFAFHKAIQEGFSPRVLLNVLNEFGDKSRSHGIPKEILIAQAECLGLPIDFIESTWSQYEQNFIAKLKNIRAKYDCTHAVYGDIDIESHRNWEEKVSNAAELTPVLPLWQKDRASLVNHMIDEGIKAMIVSCRAELADKILGKVINSELLKTFDRLGIDACGENGEYHTLVIDGPQHKQPLLIKTGEKILHKNYSFLELSLK